MGRIEVVLNSFTLLLSVTEIILFDVLVTVKGPSHRLDFSLYTLTWFPGLIIYFTADGSLELSALRILSSETIVSISDIAFFSALNSSV